MNRVPAILMAALLATACAGSGSAGSGDVQQITRLSEDVPFSGNSGFPDSAAMVIRDSVTWNDAWQRIHSWTSEVPPLPAVDFSSRMVLLAASGTRGSGGHGIEIRSIASRGDGLVATVRLTAPGQGCFSTMAITEPVDVVTVPLAEGTVSFEYESLVVDCDQ